MTLEAFSYTILSVVAVTNVIILVLFSIVNYRNSTPNVREIKRVGDVIRSQHTFCPRVLLLHRYSTMQHSQLLCASNP